MDFLKKLARRNGDAGAHAPLMIAFLGDSVTHGCFEVFMNEKNEIDTRYAPWLGYPAQLQRRLQGMYPKAAVSILNAGVSGQRAKDGLARLERDVLERKPDLVIVCFGLNDCMDGPEALPEYERSMREIFARVRAAGSECMLMTPQHMCAYVSCHVGDPSLRDIAALAADRQTGGIAATFVDAARRVAREMDVPIADAHAVWNRMAENGVDTTSLLVNDINHPSPESHAIFVEAIMARLLQP